MVDTAMAARLLGIRYDPYRSYRYIVEIDGILVGAFSQVDGLTIETDTEDFYEGGVNNVQYRLPTRTKFSDLELTRGLSDIDLLWSWYGDVVSGKIKRKNGSIFLLNHKGLPVMWWDFYDAFPIKWEGPDFKADSNEVAVEKLVLAHHGLTKPKASLVLSGVIAAAKAVTSMSSSASAAANFVSNKATQVGDAALNEVEDVKETVVEAVEDEVEEAVDVEGAKESIDSATDEAVEGIDSVSEGDGEENK